MEKPVVSVIIPVYNGEKYLKECLDSVIRQSFSHWEMICINDGSTDGSLRILEDFARMDDRIRVLSQDNQGQSAARNAGMRCAQGAYILFLDCDDRLMPDALERLTERAVEDQLDILYFDGETFFNDGLDTEEKFAGYRQVYHAKITISGTLTGTEMFRTLYESGSYRVSVCMQLFRRTFLQETGMTFYPGILYEDNLFTMKTMTQAKRTGYCHQTFYMRRIRPNSIVTQSKDYRHLRSYVIAYTQIAAYAMDAKLPAEVMPGVRAQLRSLMAHAVDVFSALDPQQREKITRTYPESSLILETVTVWEKAAQGGAAQPTRPTGIRKAITGKLQKLIAHLKEDGIGSTAVLCLKILLEKTGIDKLRRRLRAKKHTKKHFYRPSRQANGIAAAPYSPDAPFVSVILPVHNGHDYLGDTIASLQAQTMRNAEFLFVDDESSDDSLEILKRAAERDRRIQVIPQKRSNAGAARNRGLDAAKGKYVIFLDSDDTFDPNLLTYTVDRAERYDAQVVIFNADILQLPEGTHLEPDWMNQTRVLPRKIFAGRDAAGHLYQMLNPWTKLYRREYILREGFRYQSQYSTNDAYFTMMALSCAERIITLPARLVHYHTGRSGNIQSKKDRAPLDAYNAFLAARRDLRARGILDAFDRALAIKAAESMIRELNTQKKPESRQILYNALQNGGLSALGFDAIRQDPNARKQLGESLDQCEKILNEDWSLSPWGQD